MPAEQRLGLHEAPSPANLRRQPTQPGEDRTVGWPQRRAIHLATQHRQFMTEHEDLDRQFVPFGATVRGQFVRRADDATTTMAKRGMVEGRLVVQPASITSDWPRNESRRA
jgi:hypothetical protein